LPGKLPQKRLTREAARGFSSYGNQIGLATGQVREIYHPGFVAKRMEIGAVAGAAPLENVLRAVPSPGDRILLVGGRTGRDGCGGATGSSKSHTEQSMQMCGAEVQKGNPVTERKLQRLFRNPEAARMIKRCNDFGAGGVSVAVGELTDGLDIDLDMAPKKYEGLGGTELAISESQERMAVVVDARDKERFIEFCLEENVEAAEIASVVAEPRMRMRWRGEVIADLPRALMDTNGAKQNSRAIIAAPSDRAPFTDGLGGDTAERWIELMGDLNVCGQIGLSEQFDSTIGAASVLTPFGGKHQLTPAEASVCKLPALKGETNTATILAHGYDPVISEWSPFHGAVCAVVETLAKITACGGDHTRTRFSFQEYFEKLGGDALKWGKPAAGMLGAYWAQIKSGCAAIGGKDSMSGTFHDISVPPVVAAFGMCVCDARHVISPEFKRPGSKVVAAAVNLGADHLPDFGALRANYSKIHELIKSGRILAAGSAGRFGMAETLAKMCFGNGIGLRLDDAAGLFAPANGAIILEMPDISGIPESWAVVGETHEQPQIHAGSHRIPISELLNAWMSALEPIFPVKPKTGASVPEYGFEAKGKEFPKPARLNIKPRVFMPLFPGTNCEYDAQRAFERASASVDTLVFRNLTPSDVDASIAAMSKAIGLADILMFNGGFSAGDEPDGSAKFITAVCRNPFISDAIHSLIERGGLILGICNGFQALLKLGLLTQGKITLLDAGDPTLSYNTLGRHISHIAATRIVSNSSPWLANVKPGDLHSMPISHGEGRFAASDEAVRALFANGQVATVYHGENPNGSDGWIEGIISPCGRILGKMGHSERFGANTYKNIPGIFDQRIFESGVSYFMV
ncbi:MAG: phosphoribosylformylglycinamidine synthase, partial [Oscillospiraceae bacterium]|nr:phosphoribosylformylglycinamidine synthase [Oscillospiraceae bacterium]